MFNFNTLFGLLLSSVLVLSLFNYGSTSPVPQNYAPNHAGPTQYAPNHAGPTRDVPNHAGPPQFGSQHLGPQKSTHLGPPSGNSNYDRHHQVRAENF